MTLANKIIDFKLAIVNGLSSLIEIIATKIFNYPQNPGMPMFPVNVEQKSAWNYISSLPTHITVSPPQASPQTLLQAIFGNYPVMQTIEKLLYEHKFDGYYNFYIRNYKNIFFLPDWFSQWIQLNCDISIDTIPLETIREALFFGFLTFLLLMEFRIKLYWFLSINPYTRPWIYIISLTDWVYDIMTGFTPVSFGLDFTPIIFLSLTGKALDSLNNLVFTMPFLPSEGVPGKMMVDNELINVLLFRYLPSLWYSHPIPNHLREFWYNERPEIYNFMKKSYGQLDIEFLPDSILKKMYDQTLVDNNIKNLSTNLVNEVVYHSQNFIHYLTLK